MEELYGPYVFRIACVMVWVGVCMFAVAGIASQVCGYVCVWL